MLTSFTSHKGRGNSGLTTYGQAFCAPEVHNIMYSMHEDKLVKLHKASTHTPNSPEISDKQRYYSNIKVKKN